jgi:transposase
MENLQEHYALLLGLSSPWEVVDVDLGLEEKKVRISLEHPNGVQVKCPECGGLCPIADRGPERTWRHLDTMQFCTELVARTPRANCSACGVKTITVPWAEKGSRFTLMFEAFAIKVLGACGNVIQAAKLLGLGWDAVHRIMERAVERGIARRNLENIKHAGMDEKSFRKGQDYISLLNDLDRGRVLEVVEGRKQEHANALWESMGKGRESVEAVAMDMWGPFIRSASKNVPRADIVHDRFHISGYLSKAVDQIRRKENKELVAEGDDTMKGSKHLWLFNVDNLTEKKWLRFEILLQSDLRTAEAWALKENMRWFWDYKHAGNARKYFLKWYDQVVEYGETAMVKVANMIKSHLPNILTYFRHRITNAVSEGLNSKIQSIKSMARGFRGFKNYRTRILFYCGKLDMKICPSTH